jgi:endonuclease/exonuclease/phosphatase family metal-dependent hydrolase
VNLFATHLSSRGGEDIRKGQAEDLLRFVNKVSARHPADVAVLGGDMNTQPGTNAYNLLAGAFTDSYAAAVPGSPGCTFNLPGNPHCQGITSKTRRIDYIFFTGAGIHVEASEVVFNKDGWWVSDHCGLLTTLAK